MAWDGYKHSLLEELTALIERRSDADDKTSLLQLADSFFSRFPAEDLRQRSVENLYGCLYGLLHFMQDWQAPETKVRIFNPDIQSHGWESKYTVIVILCPDLPFCTASVRGELNQRNIRIPASPAAISRPGLMRMAGWRKCCKWGRRPFPTVRTRACCTSR